MNWENFTGGFRWVWGALALRRQALLIWGADTAEPPNFLSTALVSTVVGRADAWFVASGASAVRRGHCFDVVVPPAWPAFCTPVLLGTSFAVAAPVTDGAAPARLAVLAIVRLLSPRAVPARAALWPTAVLPPSAHSTMQM